MPAPHDRPAGALGANRAGPHLHGARVPTPTAAPATGATSATPKRWASARSIGQALLDRGLNAERPVVILSENDLEHALLALGCMYAVCPTAPCRRLLHREPGLRQAAPCAATLTPGLVFAADGARYGKAIAAAVGSDVEVVLAEGQSRAAPAPFASWLPPRHAAGRRRHAPPARHHRQVPVHQRLHQAAQGCHQHPRHVVRQPAANDAVHAGAGRSTARCWWTGCHGTTPLAATTTSA
jgi:hypothetical protein